MVEAEPVEEATEARDADLVLVASVRLVRSSAPPAAAAELASSSAMVILAVDGDDEGEGDAAETAGSAIRVECLPLPSTVPALADLRNVGGGGDEAVAALLVLLGVRILSREGGGAPAHSPGTVATTLRALLLRLHAVETEPAKGLIPSRSRSLSRSVSRSKRRVTAGGDAAEVGEKGDCGGGSAACGTAGSSARFCTSTAHSWASWR